MENKISKKDLYELKEGDILQIIESSKYSNIFALWKKATKVHIAKEKPNNVYNETKKLTTFKSFVSFFMEQITYKLRTLYYI